MFFQLFTHSVNLLLQKIKLCYSRNLIIHTQKFTDAAVGSDPFNQSSNRSDREKRSTSKGGPVFSKLFRLDRTDPLGFGPKFPEISVEWITPVMLALAVFKRYACEQGARLDCWILVFPPIRLFQKKFQRPLCHCTC